MSGERPIAILGSGGHARVIVDACERAGLRVAGVLAPGDAKDIGVPHLGDDAILDDAGFVAAHQFIIGIGDMRLRRTLG